MKKVKIKTNKTNKKGAAQIFALLGTLVVLAAERRLVLHNVLNGAVSVLLDPF